MLTTFARLPDELVVCIFAYLTGPNIKLSRSVCRRFANVVDLSPMLQFFIELDYAGYAEASNPRSDLSFEEKCSLLRLHNTRIRNHTFTKVDRLKLGVLGGGFSTEDEMLTSALSPSLKDGILTQWSSVLPHSYMPLQLDVAQLPSLNTGISAVTQWRMTEHNLHVCEYDVEPACDLLVLLERVSLSPGATNIVDQDVSKYRIHFRTLSTNSAHPDAVAGYLPYESRTASTWRFAIQCLGDVVVAYPPCNHTNEPVETGLVMYNWTTGALLVSIFASFE
ncbi:hypothetical protein FRC09_002630 [Ceratobasidium sp. 395]|nr:hypothetical protein FRC09_002630 [Ceratobasidium sp. 395]